MIKLTLVILTGLLFMGLFFSSLSKEKNNKSNDNTAILGMILLEDPNSFDLKGTVKELQTKWKLNVNDKDADDKAAVLIIDDYRIAIANIPVPIPNGEVEKVAAYNYFWKEGVKETSKHKGHIVLSIMNAGKNAVKENLLYCKLVSAIMNNSKSMGLYMGNRSLVLKKNFYLANIETMSEEDLPLYNWIYFGLRKEKGKQSIYTYGLVDFGKKEMEIVGSKKSIEELNEMMFNMVHYVLASDVELKDGETIGLSAEQKLQITESKGKFVDGNTLKIAY